MKSKIEFFLKGSYHIQTYFSTHVPRAQFKGYKMNSKKSSKIKKEIFDNWGNWKKIIDSNIVSKSKKPVFELLLKENDFKKKVYCFSFFSKIIKHTIKTSRTIKILLSGTAEPSLICE